MKACAGVWVGSMNGCCATTHPACLHTPTFPSLCHGAPTFLFFPLCLPSRPQALGAKLEAERQAPAAQQAAASTAGAHLSPGSRRLLERHRQRELARQMEAAGCMRADMAGCDAAGIAGHKGHAALLLSSSPQRHDDASAAGRAPSQAGTVAPSASTPFSYRPVITARAAAKPGRTPEELHAEAARRQEKLVRLRLVYTASVACSCGRGLF